jgi:hypothetical protein
MQREAFSAEIQCLQRGNALPPRSSILCLNPFIDEAGILRVGGRLENANIQVDRKHPMLLPKSHRLAELVITNEHLNTLHGGPQLILSTVRQ